MKLRMRRGNTILKPEILAPCGNMSVLRAAISAGADACYLAGNSFGARAYADNFTDEELIQAIELAHLYGVKIYLTVNTLIKESEMERVYKLLEPLYTAGLDAVLVQDLGVMRFIRDSFPLLPIHTSTQMNILSPEGAVLLKKLGAERIVAAREMTLEEMREVKEQADIQVEAFVHGAMCLCYSGRCLMSSMAGGRSGNRGRCAQPCRMRYDGSYKLSMRDMCTLRYIPELTAAGIDSFKIEGRLKNEYYVAATVDAYKTLTEDYLKGCYTDEKALYYEKRLLDTFNRGGFTTGYLMRDRRKDIKWDGALIDSSMPGRRGVKLGSIKGIKNGRLLVKLLEDLHPGDEMLIDTEDKQMLTSGISGKNGQTVELPCPKTRSLHKGIDIYRTRNKELTDELGEMIKSLPDIPVKLHARAFVGEKLSIRIEKCNNSSSEVTKMKSISETEITGDVTVAKGISEAKISEDVAGTKIISEAEISGDIIEEATNKPTTREDIIAKLSSMGGSGFVPAEVIVDTDNKGFIPVNKLKQLRREGLESLRESIISVSRRSLADREPDADKEVMHNDTTEQRLETNKEQDINKGGRLLIILSMPSQFKEAMISLKRRITNGDIAEADIIIDLGFGEYNEASVREAVDYIFSFKLENVKVILGLPYIDTAPAVKLLPYMESGILDMIDGLYIRCIDDLAFLRNKYNDKTFILSNSLYAYNSYAVKELLDILPAHTGEIVFEDSIELSEDEIRNIYKRKTELVNIKRIKQIYGRLPLMVTKGLRDLTGIITDDKERDYHIYSSEEFDYNLILSGEILSLKDYEDNIQQGRLYIFTDESADAVRSILNDNMPRGVRYTIGHYKEGML